MFHPYKLVEKVAEYLFYFANLHHSSIGNELQMNDGV